jgi:hypothetical protein
MPREKEIVIMLPIRVRIERDEQGDWSCQHVEMPTIKTVNEFLDPTLKLWEVQEELNLQPGFYLS